MIQEDCSSPNQNSSYSLGTRECTDKMCTFLSLNKKISSLKVKGVDLYPIFEMLISFRMAANNKDFSILQFSKWCNRPEILKYYHLDNEINEQTLYRAVGILGKNMTLILQEILRKLLPHLSSTTIYMDWTTVVLWGFNCQLGAYGYSRDKRDDKQQITIGTAITAMPYCIPLGMTVEPGNTCDMAHFSRTLDQISEELGEGTLIAFDKGAASKDNMKELEKHGFYYLTGLKFNASIDEQIKSFTKSSDNCLNPDEKEEKNRIYFLETKYQNHTNFLFFSEDKKNEKIKSIRQSVEKNYDEAIKKREKELKSEMQKQEGKKPTSRGRKIKVDNDFILTKRTVQVQLIDDIPKEEAIEKGVQRKLTGREGFFVLSTNKNLTAKDALRIYREKDAVEKFFYSLKNEISLGPVRSWKENNVKGICLIAYLAHLFVALTRLFIPELEHVSDKIIIYSLKNLTETFVYKGKKLMRRVISNIDKISWSIIHLKLPENWGVTSG